MKKRMISLSLVLAVMLLLAAPAFAATVTITQSGSGSVTVTQQDSTPTASGNVWTVSDDASKQITVTATPNATTATSVFVPKINGNVTTTATGYPTAVGLTYTVEFVELKAPTVTLATASDGWLTFTINGSYPAGTSFNLQLYNGQTYMKSLPAPTSGPLNKETGLEAGKAYKATATATLSGYTTPQGSFSNEITVASTVAGFALTVSDPTDNGGTINNPAASGNYASGASVPVKATPDSGYRFVEWKSSNGGSFANSKSAETTFTMPGNATTLTATFKKGFDFVVTRNEGGTVLDTDGIYAEGESVRCIATPRSGYVFVDWVSSNGGSFGSSTSASTTFTMPANATTVTATFKASGAAVTPEDDDPEETGDAFVLTSEASEGGSVVVNQNSCKEGQKVTVRANAKAGYAFSGWSSADGGTFDNPTAAATTYTMPANDATIVASFTPVTATPPADDPAADPNADPEAEDPEEGSSGGSIIWILLAAVGALVAVGAGALLILNEKKRRRMSAAMSAAAQQRSQRGAANTFKADDWDE